MWVILIGLGMMALTVAIHTFAAAWWVNFMRSKIEKRGDELDLLQTYYPILHAAIVLLCVHMFEALIWSLLYMQLPARAGLAGFGDAFYFSLVTFTTLGYGDITLNSDWQVLSGMQGMVGIVVFGLTTALMFVVLQKGWQYRHPRSD